MSLQDKKRIDILVQRQLDTISTGNGAYLATFLRVIAQTGLRCRVIFAPNHSFGNRPWANIHPRLDDLIDEVVWPRTLKIGAFYWSLSLIVWMRFFVRAIKAGLRALGLNLIIPSYLGRPLPDSEARTVAKVAGRDLADITIAEYSSMGPVLSYLGTDTQRGVLMHDILSDRGDATRAFDVQPDSYEVSREQELDWCRDADLMIYASAKELDNFQDGLPASKAVWLRPEPPVYGETAATGNPRVVFLGTTHAGNTDALQHFLAEVWPLVSNKAPDLEFWVAGSISNVMSEAEKTLPGVKVLGRVERLEDIGGADSIGVAPTRLATGVSIKVAEYLMLDMACVAYPRALQGFQGALDGLVHLADTPADFADQILYLATNSDARTKSAEQSRTGAQQALDNQEVIDFLNAAASKRAQASSRRQTRPQAARLNLDPVVR